MNIDVVLLESVENQDLSAGEFSRWLREMDAALVSGSGSGPDSGSGSDSDVPCGTCNACCRGSYFIHVTPDDSEAVAAIPEPLLFPAPGRPEGHHLLGFDRQGHCPMLIDDACSIYDERPRTCRTYDCRVFAATGIAESGSDKADITARARRWKFDYEDERSEWRHQALKTGTRFLLEEGAPLTDVLPRNATLLAMLVVRLQSVIFDAVDRGEGREPAVPVADKASVLKRFRAAIEALDH